MTGCSGEGKGVYLSAFHNCNKIPEKSNSGRKDLDFAFWRSFQVHWFSTYLEAEQLVSEMTLLMPNRKKTERGRDQRPHSRACR